MSHQPPDNPAGPFSPHPKFDPSIKTQLIERIRAAPDRLRSAVAGLTDPQLDTKYKNWTIRQITHHIADSHLHSIIRFKWALTENLPTIKAYEEADWVQLSDCKSGDVGPSLTLLDGLHSKWIQVLGSMTEQQFNREFLHPQTDQSISLWLAMNNYAWHGEHHTGQIIWLRKQNQWE